MYALTHKHIPSTIHQGDRICMHGVRPTEEVRSLSWKLLEMIADRLWTVKERAWHKGSREPCHSDDLAATPSPEPAPVVRASGKHLCHEDKATQANCCLFAYPHPIYSVSPVKQMFSTIHLQAFLVCKPIPFGSQSVPPQRFRAQAFLRVSRRHAHLGLKLH